MSDGYADNLSIDRIDNTKGYEPGNVRWATAKENCRNKKNSRVYFILGNVYESQLDAAKFNNVSRRTIGNWVKDNKKTDCFAVYKYGDPI